MKARKGFTLVEILIVVVILGILAAIVIPQFTDASTEAKEASMASDLQMLRSQIELYKIQHNDDPPTVADFVDQMTGTTDVSGDASGSDYGPYMQKIPTNPFNDSSTVTAADGGATADSGWDYDESTGEIHPDDDGTSPDGTAHYDL